MFCYVYMYSVCFGVFFYVSRVCPLFPVFGMIPTSIVCTLGTPLLACPSTSLCGWLGWSLGFTPT